MLLHLLLECGDALIIAAAEKANCDYILSEDLNAGQTYRGVSVINPFLQDSFW
jgi:predicted nucleic acid-binding protein